MKRNVLLIEQQDNVRRLYESILSVEFNVLPARNSSEALGWLKKGSFPDVVVTNQTNKPSSTDDFLRFLRSSGMFAEIPVIMLDPNAKMIQANTMEEGLRVVSNPSHLIPQLRKMQQEQLRHYPEANKMPAGAKQEVILVESLSISL